MVTNLENPNELQENSLNRELGGLKKEVADDTGMPKEIRDFVSNIEEKKSLTDDEFKKYMEYVKKYKMWPKLSNLKKVTDYQVKSLVDYEVENFSQPSLHLDNLTSITDNQAVELSRLQDLRLNGLTIINYKQAKLLGKLHRLNLDNLKSITDDQAELLSNVKYLSLGGLKKITDKQAESLSNVEWLYMYGNSDILTPEQEKIIFKKHNHFNGVVRNSY